MKSFLQQCVDLYVELAGKQPCTLRKVETPFIDEGKPEDSFGAANKCDAAQEPGILKPIAARVLMKVLYAARMCRFDLLRPTCSLATYVTKWTPLCDRKLHRLMSYVNSTLDLHMVSYMADKAEDLQVVLYSDADFGGDPETARSTTGVYLCPKGAQQLCAAVRHIKAADVRVALNP